MDTTTIWKPPPEVALPQILVPQQVLGMNYATTLQPTTSKIIPLPIKSITYLHGKPRLVWEEKKVSHMIMNE